MFSSAGGDDYFIALCIEKWNNFYSQSHRHCMLLVSWM